jgi:hypothetical protein
MNDALQHTCDIVSTLATWEKKTRYCDLQDYLCLYSRFAGRHDVAGLPG